MTEAKLTISPPNCTHVEVIPNLYRLPRQLLLLLLLLILIYYIVLLLYLTYFIKGNLIDSIRRQISAQFPSSHVPILSHGISHYPLSLSFSIAPLLPFCLMKSTTIVFRVGAKGKWNRLLHPYSSSCFRVFDKTLRLLTTYSSATPRHHLPPTGIIIPYLVCI